jgi:hypothetical protein
MRIEGIYDGSAAIHFRGPFSRKRSSAMISMALRSAAMAAISSSTAARACGMRRA